ncbi:MAG: GNAT family protein [Bacteroidota bacterium]
METLKGNLIYLRALEPSDLEFIHNLENDEAVWKLSNTITPFSKFLIEKYLKQSHRDIYEIKQLRLVICKIETNEAIGLIDIFDCDFKNKRAGIGILVKDVKDRNKGFGKESLKLLANYCKTHLDLHQLYCNVSEENNQSLKLFESEKFEIIGLKKDWNYIGGDFKNEYSLQRILT